MFDWITGLVSALGYPGVFLLMLAENIFPPIPSELIMPLAGFTAARGELNLWLVIAFGTAGSVFGALPWFYAGRLVGAERFKMWTARHGRWFTLTPSEIDQARLWFDRYGHWAVLGGRLIPAVRTLISVPAGVAKMPLAPFLFFTTIGSLAWTAALALTGYLLQSQYELVAGWLNPVSNVIVALIAIYYGYRVVTFRAQD